MHGAAPLTFAARRRPVHFFEECAHF